MKTISLFILFFAAAACAQNWEQIDSVFSPGGVTVNQFTAPAFGDLDDDGDYDLVLGNSELEIEYFENTGSNLIPAFHKDASMFVSIYAGGYQFTNSYYPALTDLDGDGDLDLTISGYNGILYYENTGTPLEPVWADVNTTLFGGVNAQIGTDAKQSFVDLDNDGDYDLIVGTGESLVGGPTPGICLGFRNIGSAQDPVFQNDNSLVTGIPDVGLNAYPSFADINEDGDFDLLLGRDGAAVYYYENTGTPAVPAWTSNNTVFNTVETTNYWKDPTFCDLDGDSDPDLIYGTSNGNLYFYENNGVGSSPQFQFNPAYFKVIKASGSATVSFADFDNDGDQDLLSGSTFGDLLYAQNNGTGISPSFDTASVIFSEIDGGFRCSPTFIDIDNDGDQDIVSGSSAGNLKVFINDGGNFTQNTTMLTNISVNYQSIPAFADMDGDEDKDLLVGSEDANNTKFYLNDGNNNFTQNTTLFTGVSFPGYCRPSLCDIDNDGDFDLFIGKSSGQITYYENTGNQFTPAWTLNNQLTAGVEVDQFAHPGFADLDGDGRKDLIVGEYNGNFTFYRNLFATPVELTSFNAFASGNNVMLNWTTSTETNNKGFAVQRRSSTANQSINQSSNQWSEIGFVGGFGTTTEPKSYSFTDGNVTSGKYSYRLKQIDFDGSFEYSKAVEVEVSVPLEFSLSQNYPNPFNPATTIKYSIPKDGYVSLKVYNALGQQVAELVNGIVKTGEHQITFEAGKLSSGVYYYRIEAGDNVSVKKMMILK